ncbi:MAG: transposase [Candidatus Hodarchaeota archaeon]
MAEDKEKTEYLKESGSFNPNTSKVKDELFLEKDFFDPRDIIQVKYEMLRKVSKEKCSVKDAVHLFGMSRQYYYKLKDVFEQKGITGLLPDKRGPKGSFKVTEDIIDFIEKTVKEEPSLNNQQIAQKIESRFHVVIHPRTIERKRKGSKKRGKNR